MKRPDWMLPEIGELTEFPAGQIARQLGKLCRYAGATPDWWSVARHSLLVAALAPDDPEHRLAALLHDCHECWTGDILRPMTAMLGGYVRDQIHDAQEYIDEHLHALIGFDPCPAILKAVATADDTACKLEMQLLGKSPAEITDALPTLREAAWHLSFQCNPRVDAMHWRHAFNEAHAAVQANDCDEPCITDEEWQAAQAKAREEHAMLKAEYLREREKDGER